jgi:serine protease Do
MKNIILGIALSFISSFALADSETVFNNNKDSVVTIYGTVNTPAQSLKIDDMMNDALKKYYHLLPINPTTKSYSIGSGSIITEDGYVVTNYHVIANAVQLKVTTFEGKEYDAVEVGHDEKGDIAVIKIKGKNDWHPVEFGDSDKVSVGNEIFAIGSPLDLEETMTRGIISSTKRIVNENPFRQFQVDAPINHGNSGGPLFDKDGKEIGMNSEILSPTNANIGLGFAIPSNVVKKIAFQIIKNKKYIHPIFGLNVVSFDEIENIILGFNDDIKSTGVFVVNNDENGAAKNVIQRGDVIVSCNGKSIIDVKDFIESAYLASVGDTFVLDVYRDGKFIKVNVNF